MAKQETINEARKQMQWYKDQMVKVGARSGLTEEEALQLSREMLLEKTEAEKEREAKATDEEAKRNAEVNAILNKGFHLKSYEETMDDKLDVAFGLSKRRKFNQLPLDRSFEQLPMNDR